MRRIWKEHKKKKNPTLRIGNDQQGMLRKDKNERSERNRVLPEEALFLFFGYFSRL